MLGIGGMIALTPHLSYAVTVAEIQQQIAAKKAEQETLVKKSTALNTEVTTLKGKLIGVSKTLQNSEGAISATEEKLKSLHDVKAGYLQNLYKDQTTMGGFVTAAQRYARTTTPTLLVQSRPIDAARASALMKMMIPALQQQSGILKSQLQELDKVEAEISGQQQKQVQEYKEINEQQGELTSLLEERKKLYRQTESQRKVQEKEMQVLAAKAKNIEDLMEKLERQRAQEKPRVAVLKLPPNIPLPVRGMVRINFGEKDDLGAISHGITLTARAGATVVMPIAGTVKFAGTFQKYKQILIVEHQGGYHSLIAGLAKIDTVVGASLAAGEPIGTAENSETASIYYELRQNGKPINPQKLLMAQRKQDKS
jgi:septal ring factor EnvC (AmiA/AmiB activator)